MTRTKLIVALMLFLSLVPAIAAEKELTLGQQLVQYAKKSLGKQVGTGECANLVEVGYREIGAQRRGKDDPNEGDYTWGKLIVVFENKEGKESITGKLAELQAGDVIQMRNCRFEGPLRDGRRGKYRQSADHHTAIVAWLGGNGRIVHVVQQNEGGNHKVTEGTFYLSDLKAGWLRFYRPQAAD